VPVLGELLWTQLGVQMNQKEGETLLEMKEGVVV